MRRDLRLAKTPVFLPTGEKILHQSQLSISSPEDHISAAPDGIEPLPRDAQDGEYFFC